MGKQSYGKLITYLPVVFLATCAVVVIPMAVVVWLRGSGVVSSIWAGMAIGVVLSLLVSQAGAAAWKRTESEVLFSELMLWGWVKRWRNERRLTAASDLLGLTVGRPEAISGGHLTSGQKTGLLTQLTSGLEARDQYTHGHSRRVARHAATIAKQMGLSRDEVAKIRAAGAMHDVGKVETPVAVLHKEGKLTDEEYAIVKRHPVDGAVMVATLDDDELTAIVRHHHERLDGTGYPDGLAGEEIPLGARILAVADTFDAITSTRPYRHANAHKKALDILAAEAGTQLDPDAVRAFLSCYSGRRPLAYWTMLANGRPKIVSWLGEGLSPAHAASAMGTAATAAAVGAAAMVPLVAASPESPRLAAEGDAIPASLIVEQPPSSGLMSRTALMASFQTALPPDQTALPPDAVGGTATAKGFTRAGNADRPSPKGLAGIPNVDLAEKESRGLGTQGQAPAQRPVEAPASDKEYVKENAGPRGNEKAKGHGNANANGQGKGNANGQGNSNPNGQGISNPKGQDKAIDPVKVIGEGKDNGNAGDLLEVGGKRKVTSDQ